MCQAKVADILDTNYVTSDATHEGYKLYKTKGYIIKESPTNCNSGVKCKFLYQCKNNEWGENVQQFTGYIPGARA
eukprot:9639363-Ditylum_brightwellii.AAC.1